MVSIADFELAPGVAWVGSLSGLIFGDGLVSEIRDYPNRAAAEAAIEAMQR
jgi:hypothetical protein